MTAAGGQPSGVRSHPSPVSGPALVLAAAVLWGTVGIASRLLYGIEDIPPLVVGFFRLALAVPLLGLWCWWRLGPETFRFDGSDRLRIAGIGLTMAAYQACYFQAVADVGVALATLITICSAPVIVGILAIVLLREKVSRTVVTALGLGLIGAVLLIGTPPAEDADPVGILWACGSALAYSGFVLLSRSLAGRHDPGKIIVTGFGAGAVMLLPLAIAAGMTPGVWTGQVWSALLYMGLVPTGLAYVLYFCGMKATQATPASIIALAEPLTATTLAFVLFGERLGPSAIAGAILLIVTMVLLVRSRPRSGW
ncbi:DME family drug/metabolite transporter [Mesorhizobium sp. J18]|uniref:DMT family transporter n=1 Tax=Mesorhizobium sp. J18 TaxID=935263 RepID=UPI00119B2089|nr:EamA family transporter [Mesorhizobium sp. J18]TWG96289.1 DME family drug/metabolite transporter [Mesorhizobium sp. J18]